MYASSTTSGPIDILRGSCLKCGGTCYLNNERCPYCKGQCRGGATWQNQKEYPPQVNRPPNPGFNAAHVDLSTLRSAQVGADVGPPNTYNPPNRGMLLYAKLPPPRVQPFPWDLSPSVGAWP